MRLRKPCPHDRYEEHPCIDGNWVSQLRIMRITDDERPLLTLCPGGEFLPEGALVIEKVKSEWPDDAAMTVMQVLVLNHALDDSAENLDRTAMRILDHLAARGDALASQVGESE